MKQAIAGVAPPELGEVTIMTVWPSVGGTPLGPCLRAVVFDSSGFLAHFHGGQIAGPARDSPGDSAVLREICPLGLPPFSADQPSGRSSKRACRPKPNAACPWINSTRSTSTFCQARNGIPAASWFSATVRSRPCVLAVSRGRDLSSHLSSKLSSHTSACNGRWTSRAL